MKIDQHWSVGLGPDFHYMSLQSKSYVNTVTPATSDSISRFTGNNWGHGAHIGILYRYDDTTRVGLNYRSKIVMNLKGYSDFSGSGIGSFESDAFQLNIPLPPTTTLSVYHDMTPCWAMMGTIAYDQWGVLNHYHAQSYMQPTGPIPSVVLPQNFSNTFDLSVGTHLKLDQQWMLRGSLKYEGTPTNNSFRDVNFPDGQKLGINLGARYRMRKNLAFDFVVAHVFTRSVHINGVNPLTGATAIGHENVSIDLAGAQIVWDI
jgi:long-chain fatty acid transport protein